MLECDMDLKLILGTVSFFIAIAGVIPYIINIIKKKTVAHVYTWLIWAILQTIAVVAQIKNGAGFGAGYGIAGSLACYSVMFLSLKNGFKNIKKFDTFCLILALISMIIYIGLKNPLLAVIMATATNFIGSLPTLRKTFVDPSSETMSAYLFGGIGVLLSILALQNYTLITSLYLINIILIDTLLVGIMIFKKKISDF
jgi:hypothetical protein